MIPLYGSLFYGLLGGYWLELSLVYIYLLYGNAKPQ